MNNITQNKNITHKNIIEIMVVLYFVLGGFKKITLLDHASYTISLLIQVYTAFLIFKFKKKINYLNLTILFINFFLLVIITAHYILINVETTKIVNRMFPLLSIFGLISIFLIDDFVDINKVLKKIFKMYFYVGLIILLDALSYIIFKISIWPPIMYLGLRFSGPFFDPNYLGLFYGSMSLILIFYKEEEFHLKKSIKYRYLIIYLLTLLITFSWTSIIILFIAIFTSFVIKFKNMFLKQIYFLVSYYILLNYSYYNLDYLRSIFVSIVGKVMNLDYTMSVVKFHSLGIRIVTQMNALHVDKNFLGMGPRTIVPLLTHDTHNSFVAILFEVGVPGLLLIIINVRYKYKFYDKCLDVLSTFIILMAFTLDVHYTVTFTLMLILMEWRSIRDKKLSGTKRLVS